MTTRKRIAIVGKGTVGCITVAHFLRYTDWEIDWYFDPDTPASAVGEGTGLHFPRSLRQTLNFNTHDLKKVSGTLKTGIWKKNWGGTGDFFHPFPLEVVGIHFYAIGLQEYIFDILKVHKRINVIEKFVDEHTIDADYVIVCAGTPKTYDDFIISGCIPVNSCWVTQCPWDHPKFNYTLTIAKQYGWIFGIPLQNRCSIGYLFNKNLTDLESVKQDVEDIFKEYDLTPGDQRRYLEFENYYRKVNFSDRITYNGNASFFLEPLEATSTGFADRINRLAFDLYNGNITKAYANNTYHSLINEIESMISLHYFAGSKYKNNFWYFAEKIATTRIISDFQNQKVFCKFAVNSLNYDDPWYFLSKNDLIVEEIGSWSEKSYYINLKGLGLDSTFLSLAKLYL